jgi:hypothetical protein
MHNKEKTQKSENSLLRYKVLHFCSISLFYYIFIFVSLIVGFLFHPNLLNSKAFTNKLKHGWERDLYTHTQLSNCFGFGFNTFQVKMPELSI